MKKAEYSAYWRISKTGKELVISLASPAMFLQRKVQAFEKEGRGGQEGEWKIHEQERAERWRQCEILGKNVYIPLVVILMKLSALHYYKMYLYLSKVVEIASILLAIIHYSPLTLHAATLPSRGKHSCLDARKTFTQDFHTNLLKSFDLFRFVKIVVF